jgi:hypothetical protein
VRAAVLLVALAAAATAAPAGPAPPQEALETEKPFPPCDRSVILREEKVVYLVEGKVRIPRGVEISIQKDVRIRARSAAGAEIEVEGALKVHGVDTREVVFQGVTVVPSGEFARIHLDQCIFRGGGCIRTSKEARATGPIRIEGCSFGEGARIDLALGGSEIDLSSVQVAGAIRLQGVDGRDSPNRLRAVLRECAADGLEVRGLESLTVRASLLRGGPVEVKDCGDVLLDGDKIEAREIRFLHSTAGGLARTRLSKCDLYSKRIVFRTPLDPRRSDAVVLDKCWFEGVTAADRIAERLVDGADEEGNNARASATNPQERPLELGGRVNR